LNSHFFLPNATSIVSPLIIGHRGASTVAPENTLLSFARALDDSADGVELDVRLARDGVPVVIHDANLRRTGQVRGVVARMTSSELGGSEVGSWFNQTHPRKAKAEYSRQFVPTLEQTLGLFQKHPARPGLIYLEMKTDRAKDTYLELCNAVAQLVRDHRLESRVVVVSFNLNAVARIKALDPGIRTGALFEPRRHTVKIIRRHPMIAAALESGADEILLHRTIANRRNVDLSLESNLRPVVWTVDSPKWMLRGADLGIHAVLTNDPAGMIASK
jgi:glycerophosphoryl diester phosphodiesterase